MAVIFRFNKILIPNTTVNFGSSQSKRSELQKKRNELQKYGAPLILLNLILIPLPNAVSFTFAG